ncbi:hypothetical protein GCM10023200_35060 [Actinomycetospora chlora]|uniref:Uncharacterized protein n=1 Tax=Actinomycetospora chlora TaxID=663608 RepID=A0ABP9BLG4_9PSEU
MIILGALDQQVHAGRISTRTAVSPTLSTLAAVYGAEYDDLEGAGPSVRLDKVQAERQIVVGSYSNRYGSTSVGNHRDFAGRALPHVDQVLLMLGEVRLSTVGRA